MSWRSPSLPAAVGVLAAAVAGAGLALGGAAIFGGFGGSKTTTVRQVIADGGASPASFSKVSKSLSINEIYRRDAPGVVQVTSTSVVRVPSDPFFGNPFGLPATEQQQALGSGFVIDKAGHIVTNYHVVQGAKSVEVSFSNNERMKARLVGTDPSTDIAVLQVKASSRALTPLPLGDSDTVRVGDQVLAIGNPFGLDRTATAGIVSALQRPIQAPNGDEIDHVIQTDAALNHGNSGGPLIDASARVIGVNSQIQSGGLTDGNVGIGFAVPINTVKTVVAQLIENGRVDHAFIGVQVQPITAQVARIFHLGVSHGLLVEVVQRGSAAAKAGLEAGTTNVTVAGESYRLGGDVIVKADGVAVGSLARLRDLVSAKKPGETMTLEIRRNGKPKTIIVTLGKRPAG
jgi:S1-C subfamily serine protease